MYQCQARSTAAVLGEVFKGQAEVFQVLFQSTDFPLDFLWCIQNLYTAGEWVVAQRKRLLDLHCIVSVRKEDRFASSKTISLHAGPSYQYVGIDFSGWLWLLWHLPYCHSLEFSGAVYPPCSWSVLQPKRSALPAFSVWLAQILLCSYSSMLTQLRVITTTSYRNAETQHVCCLHFQEITWSSSYCLKS